MENTILLAKVLGIFITIAGFIILVRRSYFIPVVNSFAKEHFLRLILASIEMIAGLFLIMVHNSFSTLPEILITLVGWMAIIESLFYFSASDETIAKLLHHINTRRVYLVGGMTAIVMGLYLTSYGFSLL